MMIRKGDGEKGRWGEKSRHRRVAVSQRHRVEQICAACGTSIERITAKYCLVCGKVLNEDYQPLDALRSSYRMQGKSFLIENAESEPITDLFEINKNPVSEMAWASFVYSMVPYLGVIFIPFTIIIGCYGYFVALGHPKASGKKLSLISIGLSFIVLAVQIFLWWLLYLIPELSGKV